MARPEGFICKDEYLKKLAKLSDQEVGRLFRALMKYHKDGETQELTGRESVAFDFIQADIDSADAAYAEKCATNRKNRTDDGQRPITTVNDRQRTRLIIIVIITIIKRLIMMLPRARARRPSAP